MQHRTTATLTIALAALLGACSDADDGDVTALPPDADAVVSVDDHSFGPGSVDVAAGDTVAWLFEDRSRHDVSFDDGPASPIQKAGTWSRTFDEPGQYTYLCSLHPNMTGTVVVSEAAPNAAG